MNGETQDDPPVVCPKCGAVVPPRKEPPPLRDYQYCPACRQIWRESGQAGPAFVGTEPDSR
jgi:hypothetical protein